MWEDYTSETPYFEDTPGMMIFRAGYGASEAFGSVVPYMMFPSHSVIGSAALFGGMQGVNQIVDPDIREGLTLDKWLVHTGLSTTMGAVFPFLTRLGGEAAAQPNNIKAFGQYLLQITAISSATTAEAFAATMYDLAKENPDKPMMDILKETSEYVANPEQIIKHVSTMVALHSAGLIPRIVPKGKQNAVKLEQLIKNANELYKGYPAGAGKAPKTIKQAQDFMDMWINRRADIVEALKPYGLESRRAQSIEARTKSQTAKETGRTVPETRAFENLTEAEKINLLVESRFDAKDVFVMTPEQRIQALNTGEYTLSKAQIAERKTISVPTDKAVVTPEVTPEVKPETPPKVTPKVKPKELPNYQGLASGDGQPKSVKVTPKVKPKAPPKVKDVEVGPPIAVETKEGTVAKSAERSEKVVKDILIDEKLFQPRDVYDNAVIDNIANKFDPKKWKPPTLWEDPATGKFVVIDGHHRHKGVLKGGMEKAEYVVLPKGTTLKEAQEFAITANLSRTQQSDFENANVVRKLRDGGKSYKQIGNENPGLAPKAKTEDGRAGSVRSLEPLSYLDRNGMFREVYEFPTDFPQIVSKSKFIGSLRKKHSWLSNQHEKDLFDYFYKDGAIKNQNKEAVHNHIYNGIERIQKAVDGGGSAPNRLDFLLKEIKDPRESFNPEAYKNLQNLKNQRNLIRDARNADNITESTYKNLSKDLTNLNAEIALAETKLDKAYGSQETLFRGSGPSQANIFGGFDKLQKPKSKKQIDLETGIKEYKEQLIRDENFALDQFNKGKISESSYKVLKANINTEKNILNNKAEKNGLKKPFNLEKQREMFFREGETKNTVAADEKIIGNSNWKESDLRNVITLRDIGKKMVKGLDYSLGQKLRTGLVKRFARRALGFFRPSTGHIRINNINDINTMAHEFGHYFDISLFRMSEKMKTDPNIKQIEREVVLVLGRRLSDLSRDKRIATLYKKYGQSTVDTIADRFELRSELKNLLKEVNYPKSQWSVVEEGVAEFTRLYVTDVNTAKRLAPKFFTIFESTINQNPNLKKVLVSTRRQLEDFNNQNAVSKIHAGIVRSDQKEGSFLNGLIEFKNEFYHKFVDGLSHYRKYEKELFKKFPNLKGSENPLKQVTSLFGIDGKVKQFMKYRPFLRKGNDVEFQDGKPLLKIVKSPLKKGILDSYGNYLVALRNVELHNQNKPKAATESLKTSLQAVKDIEAKYGKQTMQTFAKDMYQYQDVLLKYYRDSGMISKEVYNTIKDENNYYIPFKRYFDEFELTKGGFRPRKGVKPESVQKIKGIKGSTKNITDPVESVFQNTYELLFAADENIAKNTLIQSLQKYDKTLVMEIPTKTLRMVKDVQSGNYVPTIEVKAPPGRSLIHTRVNGELKFYEIPQKLYDAFMYVTEPVAKMPGLLTTPTKFLRQGAVVYDPTFAFRNVARDQISALFYSKYGYSPVDYIKGLYATIGKKESYQRFLASGADQSFLAATDLLLERNIHKGQFDLKLETTFDRYKRKPQSFLQDFSRGSELGTRVGAFRNAYSKTGDVFSAMQEARDIAADYGIRGSKMGIASQLYAFLNARIQHTRMIAASVKTPKALKDTAVTGTLYITPVAIANWFNNNMVSDEVRQLYENLPGWQKVGFFNFHLPGTRSFLPLPKGAYGVAFGSSVEASLDWALNNDPSTLKDIPKSIFNEVSPVSSLTDLIPQAGRPIAELYGNTQYFTGAPIVPKSMEGLEKSEQYDNTTNRVLIKLGEQLDVSPKQMEYAIRAYFAGVGSASLYLTDELLQQLNIVEERNEDTWTRLSKLPLTRAIIQEPKIGIRGAAVQKVYKTMDNIERINKQVNRFIADGNAKKAQEYLNKKDNRAAYLWYIQPLGNESTQQTELSYFKSALRFVKHYEQEINKDTTLTPKQKRIKKETMQSFIDNNARKLLESFETGDAFYLDDDVYDLYYQSKLRDQDISRERKFFRLDVR